MSIRTRRLLSSTHAQSAWQTLTHSSTRALTHSLTHTVLSKANHAWGHGRSWT